MRRRGDRFEELLDDFQAKRIDRREFVERAAGLGLATSAAGGVLAGVPGAAQAADLRHDASGISTQLLRLRLDDDIGNLDPAIQPGHSDDAVAHNIFEHLVAFKPGTFQRVNVLAEKFLGSKDGLRWDFTLRKGIHFHKGFGEMTAEDVKFSFERIAGLTHPKLKSPYQSDWAALKEVKVTGRYTGTIILKQPYAPLMTTTVPGQSGEIVSKKAVLQMGNAKFGTHPIGTGPYEFVSWTPKQNVKLKRFAGYSGAALGFTQKPIWSNLEFLVIGEDNATMIALESGALDFSTLPTSGISRLSSNPKFNVVKQTTLNYNWIGMNVRHPNLQDKRVRMAVMYGIDVPSILQGAFDGRYTRAHALIAPGMPLGYWKKAPVYQRDVNKARGFLTAAGKKDLTVTMSVSKSEPGAATIAQIVQSNLNDVGFKVDVQIEDGAIFDQATKAANQKKQIFYTGFTTLADPEWDTTWFTCSQVNVWNYMSWCNPEFSRLEKLAAKTPNEKKRNAMYVRMQQLMDADKIALWVAWPTVYFAVRKGLVPKINPNAVYDAWDFRTV